jgi:hypothetical protein
MKRLALTFLLALSSLDFAEPISTKVLTPGTPIKVDISPTLTTTLLFPGPISGTFGLGLVSSTNSQGGSVQIEHPDGSNVLVLHALSGTAHVVATVLLDGALYVLDLQANPAPDVAVTLVKNDPASPRAAEVTPEEITAQRLKFDPELLVGFLRRAHDAALLRPLYPNLYEGYSSRSASYTSECDTYKTTVATVHRFSKEDAVVLEGTVQNKTDKPLVFDGRAATALVSNEVHPIKLLSCLRPIPPHETVPIDVVIQGDIDGGRAHLAIENEYRIMLPGDTGIWSMKNGSAPDRGFTVPSPISPKSVPLTQTGKK